MVDLLSLAFITHETYLSYDSLTNLKCCDREVGIALAALSNDVGQQASDY